MLPGIFRARLCLSQGSCLFHLTCPRGSDIHNRVQTSSSEPYPLTPLRSGGSLQQETRGDVPSSPTLSPFPDLCCPAKGDLSDEDDDNNEFFDAPEIFPMPDIMGHKRTGSNISGTSSDISLDEQYKHQVEDTKKEKRTRIPYKPNYSLNLWSIMKNCIGKELSKIPMPVNFNEPLSMLQRLTEDLEYHELLDRAARCESSLEQLCYVAAFTVSSYSTTVFRTSKPFNPLLGETFELDRLEESGYRSLCEQVSHHPPAAAHHADSKNGWTLRQEIKITSKFRGKYLSIMPLGTIHCVFHSSGNHYTWKKVTTTVHNIIVGKLWIDQVGSHGWEVYESMDPWGMGHG
ncbi:LOW QUALITY PROTEIN: hypothetical protein Nmel_006339 [Mimus melanotis]